jgi:hypothetical protein
MQRLGDGLLVGLDPLWNVPGLDPDGLVRLTDVGGADLAAALVRGLVGSAHDASRGAVDLLDPAYLWNAPAERASHRTFGYGTHAFRRVFWPSLDVALVADAQRSLTLVLTLRRPGLASADGQVIDSGGEKKPGGGATGEDRDVAVFLNHRPITSIRVGTTWRREKVTLQAAALEPGLNRLRLTFPAPAPDADAALARIGEGLDLGIGAEIHPCFGEIFRLVAHPAAEG